MANARPEIDLKKISGESLMSPIMRRTISPSFSATHADKLRSEPVTCHYTSKYWVRLNPNDATKPIDAPRDNTFFGNPLTRLLLLPIWLPYLYWSRQKKKSEMREFVVAGIRGRTLRDALYGKPTDGMPNLVGDVKVEIPEVSLLADDGFMRKLAWDWVGLHPADFIFGERNSKIAKLQRTFEGILSEVA